MRAADHFTAGDVIALDKELSGADPLINSFYAIATGRAAAPEARAAFEQIAGSGDYVHDEHVLALDLFLLSGLTDEASRHVQRLLQRKQALSNRWYVRCLQFFVEPNLENERKLIRDSHPFGDKMCFAYYSIGMVALSRGDRESLRRRPSPPPRQPNACCRPALWVQRWAPPEHL